jgi:hypothetical protein
LFNIIPNQILITEILSDSPNARRRPKFEERKDHSYAQVIGQLMQSKPKGGNEMKNKWILLIVVIIALSGCGGGSTYSGGSTPATSPIATGQWEFNFNNSAYLVEVNLSDNGPGVASGGGAIALEQKFFSAPSPAAAIGLGGCNLPSQNAIDGDNTTSVFNGFLDIGNNEDDTLNGIFSPEYTSISAGTVTGGNVLCGQNVPLTTFTATVVPPINGTFTGMLSSSDGFEDQASFAVSQTANSQQITFNGTTIGNGVTTTFSVPAPSNTSTPSGPASTNPAQAIGAYIQGTGSATNPSGTYNFTFVAHYNSATKQIYVKGYNTNTGEGITGYLSQQ